jgi:hypothetical protein
MHHVFFLMTNFTTAMAIVLQNLIAAAHAEANLFWMTARFVVLILDQVQAVVFGLTQNLSDAGLMVIPVR